MNYHPNDLLMWDAWYWVQGDTVHAFHLQRLAPGSAKTAAEEHAIGHAISRDLVHWEERPPAVAPGAEGEPDDMELFTGCNHVAGGKYYLFYTMRGSREAGRVQRIGAAVSDDLEHWEKHPGNPLIVPDGRWYHTPENPAPYGIVDCRDLCVVDAPDGNGYYGFYAARVPAGEMAEGAAVACCRSADLAHWEQLPPAFVSKRHTIVEVPEVFELEGRWYMLLLSNNEYGNRNLFPGEPELTMGTIYAVADHIEGPYREPADNTLLASRQYNGISCRTLMFGGRRMVLYTSPSRVGGTDSGAMQMGVLSTPKELALRDGRLCALYSALIESAKGDAILDSGKLGDTVPCALAYQEPGKWQKGETFVEGKIRTAWARYTFQTEARSFLYRARVTVHSGVGAGLAFKMHKNGYGGAVFLLDCDKGEAQLLHIPQMAVIDARKVPLVCGRAYDVRVVAKDKYLECYLDDELILQCVFYAAREGHLGLVVDRADARFEAVSAHLLECPVDDW